MSKDLNWEQMVSTLPSGVIILAADGCILYANGQAVDMLGEPLCGVPWVEVIQSRFAPKEDDGHEISLLDGRRVNVAIQSLNFAPGELVLLTDITKTRQLETARGRFQRLAEMGEMTAHLAHQIRTPLASAMLYVDNLTHADLPEDKKAKFINKVKESHANIEQQIRDLLVFAKGGASLLTTLSFDDFYAGIDKNVQALFDNKKMQFVIESVLHNELFKSHSESLQGAIINLIDNAINAGAKVIQLKVLLSDNDKLIFSVIDDGCGMNLKTKKEALRAFFTTRAKGTGLGLAVVEAVAHAHAGEVNVQSEIDVGSCISIIIPFVSENTKEKK